MTGSSPHGAGRGAWALLVLAVPAAWVVVLGQPRNGPPLVSSEAWSRMLAFLGRLAGSGVQGTASFETLEAWRSVGGQALGTLTLSVAAATTAAAFALVTAAVAARPGPESSVRRRILGWIMRLAYAAFRSIPEIVWALLAVLVLRPGPLSAAAALALHNAGVLGRLLTDVVEDLDPRVDDALRVTGAGTFQRYLYGTLPRVLPRCLTFGLYRWEVIIRTTVVVEAVTGTGLGSTLRLALSGRSFTLVTVVLLTYVALVLMVDAVSALARRWAR